ncbi:MAG: hypothetical protein CM1200mP2_16650 [Planctomycetaceae bacterium]|nr:MAG: hypothetical protein CM1200mP2_16650 [Planctomycetaceae bacterium]
MPGVSGPDGPPRLPPFMEPFDTNRDGEISAEEIKNAAAVLRKLDRNRDGRITEDELPPPPEGRGFRGPGGGPGGPMRQERKLVKQFDKDGNGRLNLQERQAARKLLGHNKMAGAPVDAGSAPRDDEAVVAIIPRFHPAPRSRSPTSHRFSMPRSTTESSANRVPRIRSPGLGSRTG